MGIRNRLAGGIPAAGLVLLLVGCTGKDPLEPCPPGTTGTAPSCVAIAPPCTQSVVDSGNGSANPHTIYFKDFSVPDTGRLDITVDWTIPADRIGVYVVPANTCTIDELNARSCNFLVRQEPSASSAKPLKVSTPSFNAGNYRWMIGNAADAQESLAYQFVLSKGTCAPLAGSAPGASGLAGAATVPFRQALPMR